MTAGKVAALQRNELWMSFSCLFLNVDQNMNPSSLNPLPLCTVSGEAIICSDLAVVGQWLGGLVGQMGQQAALKFFPSGNQGNLPTSPRDGDSFQVSICK